MKVWSRWNVEEIVGPICLDFPSVCRKLCPGETCALCAVIILLKAMREALRVPCSAYSFISSCTDMNTWHFPTLLLGGKRLSVTHSYRQIYTQLFAACNNRKKSVYKKSGFKEHYTGWLLRISAEINVGAKCSLRTSVGEGFRFPRSALIKMSMYYMDIKITKTSPIEHLKCSTVELQTMWAVVHVGCSCSLCATKSNFGKLEVTAKEAQGNWRKCLYLNKMLNVVI